MQETQKGDSPPLDFLTPPQKNLAQTICVWLFTIKVNLTDQTAFFYVMHFKLGRSKNLGMKSFVSTL
jgi:hypothetical protein